MRRISLLYVYIEEIADETEDFPHEFISFEFCLAWNIEQIAYFFCINWSFDRESFPVSSLSPLALTLVVQRQLLYVVTRRPYDVTRRPYDACLNDNHHQPYCFPEYDLNMRNLLKIKYSIGSSLQDKFWFRALSSSFWIFVTSI